MLISGHDASNAFPWTPMTNEACLQTKDTFVWPARWWSFTGAHIRCVFIRMRVTGISDCCWNDITSALRPYRPSVTHLSNELLRESINITRGGMISYKDPVSNSGACVTGYESTNRVGKKVPNTIDISHWQMILKIILGSRRPHQVQWFA